MGKRIRHLLNTRRNKISNPSDVYLKTEFKQTARALPYDDINYVLSENDVFNEERQSSKCYRIISTVSILVGNPLYDTTGQIKGTQVGLSFLGTSDFIKADEPNGGDDLDFDTVIDRFITERDGWFGFKYPEISTTSFKPSIEYKFTPSPDQLLPQYAGTDNWKFRLTYPAFSAQTTGDITDGGLLMVETQSIVVGGRDITLFTTPVKHNLNVNSQVLLKDLVSSSFDGKYTVVKIGDINGNDEEYTFGVDLGTTTNQLAPDSRMVRVVNGIESKYYFRKFKVLSNDYEIYKLPFSKQLFDDNNYQVTFEDINISGLTDNLNRPLSELYITSIKLKGDVTVPTRYTPIKSGLEIPFISNMSASPSVYSSVPDIRRITSDTINTFDEIENNITETDTEYYGDVVEYNESELLEYVLADVHHRFNTLNRETSPSINGKTVGPKYEGYYYKAHNKITLKNFSNYVEQGDINTAGIPDYATTLPDGRIIWRDLLDIGVNDGQQQTIDYPFANGCHYLYDVNRVSVKRQDPYNAYGVYYTGDYPDISGDIYDTTDFETNDAGDNC